MTTMAFSVAGLASPLPRPRGRHALRSRSFADELVATPGSRLGRSCSTSVPATCPRRALVGAGAGVRAIELDHAALGKLRARFSSDPRVEIVEGDATQLPLRPSPSRSWRTCPSRPAPRSSGGCSAIQGPLTQLDAIVEWGLAAKRTAVWPSTLLGCAWGAWYELELVRRVPRACFAPPPSVDAAVPRATRRGQPLVPPAHANSYEALLRRAFAARAPLDRMFRGASFTGSPASLASIPTPPRGISTRANGRGSTWRSDLPLPAYQERELVVAMAHATDGDLIRADGAVVDTHGRYSVGDVEDDDLELRRRTYGFFVEHGRAPTAAELGERDEVLAGWRRLHDEHAVVLNPSTDELRMLNPFSVVPTAYRVQAGGRWWYGNCAWDAFGICAALHADGRVETSCPDCGEPLAVEVQDERPDDESPPVPLPRPGGARWDDIVFT